MLIVQRRIAPQASFDADLVLPFEQRQKTRLRTIVAGGEEIGLFLERGGMLRDGEFLQADDERVVAAEELLEVCCSDLHALARAAAMGADEAAGEAGAPTTLPRVRLLQLASPALPIGPYSYSQGLERAVEDGIVRDAASA